MEENSISPVVKKQLPAPNPVTKRAYRRDVLRQITLPIILILLVSIAIVTWLVIENVGTIQEWSSISLILLTLPALLLGIIIFILFIALIVLVSYLLKFLPPYARLTQDAINNLENQIKSGADISAKPIIQIQSFLAVIDILLGRK
ncbi:MAG: hypothetical protein HON98_07135 [Chloroflexi bacterium]|jgi:hypothetical protein|nr:hypothetical protein [Chloroflexota bacterium]MBT3669716.1 hypothetical protein [Chloroflexota bacterium]MBT4004113.1 hypothetical protein [Chloroflexota bacterium]MBT4305196.1 hypothetical protein [Chloroflexota bacterium]MBT4534881.1 hypothetical protein [Chloroflexota bacterium]